MVQDEGEPVTALLVGGDTRLSALAAVLADEGITVETTETLSADTAAGCDLVVVPHDETTTPAVDGVAAVERAVETVECPVVLYAVGFPGADVAIDALDAGAADAIYVPLERGELLARRVRCVATGEDGFADPAQLLEDFFEYYTEDIFIKDDTSRIAVGSNGTGQPQGYDREQLVGLTDYELLPPDLADALYEQEQRIRETGEPVVNAVEHFLQDGEDRWVATTKVPRYEDGEITGLVGGTRDVTHLRWRERLVARLHEASRDLMRAETTTDVCRVTTDIAADITALPAVQVVVHDGSLLTPADTDCGSVSLFADYERWFWRAFETGDPQYVTEGPEGESPTDLADPSTIDVAVFPLGDHGALGMRASEATFDEFTLDLANVLSATVEASLDRAEREAALRDHERELRLRNERLEEFAMMVSHDLRNPLQVAMGATDLLDADSPHVDRIDSALEQMDRLVDELLTLADRGEIVGDRVEVDPARLSRRAWSSIDTDGVALEVGEIDSVVADSERLRQLLEHLFWELVRKNEGGGTVRVEETAAGDGLAIEFSGTSLPEPLTELSLSDGGLPTDETTPYARYIVSTIAEAYGWAVTTTGTDGHARFEITGLEDTR
ncbi:PAS domain-containing sensor histidine kinase [Haloarcula pelagica]|uniref:PAS domain-containing sensor histidine kinase n=1 Tax=Haloarcula pelagica TaxID=3033389 RepID=UPI0024C41AB2|nr:PAS domain S-box protein [Halomicroarcula sp. YJ-61-S]